MTNEEAVMAVMAIHDCQTSKSYSMDALRLFHYVISPASVSAVLRRKVAQGLVGKSPNDRGTAVYWLTESGRRKACESPIFQEYRRLQNERRK